MKYTAIFSTGTITRTSKREYKTAGAFVSNVTGKIKNVTFSKGIASPDPDGIFCTKIERHWYKTETAYQKAVEKNEKAKAEWEKEIVKVAVN